MDEKKVGVVQIWNESRGFGIVRVGDRSSLERYFLHISKIKSGTAIPDTGMIVHFHVGPAAKEGQLLQALDAEIDVQSIQPSSNGGVK